MQKYQRKGSCYGHHKITHFYQFLKEVDKGKTSDGVPVRIGKKQLYGIDNYKSFECFYSSCHKSWKNQTKVRKQYLKSVKRKV
ncbi:MAG: hypothetical protein QM489_00570 [Candidatus Izemoplasma sp.]